MNANTKNTARIAFVNFFLSFFVYAPLALAATPPLTVTISKIVDHPSLDAIERGIKEAITTSDLAKKTTIRIQTASAQGSPVIAAQIAQKFVGESPSVLVPITTPSAQTMATANKIAKIPLVFAAVSDPKGAQLIGGHTKESFITGVQDTPPLTQQLDVIEQMFPGKKRIGVLFNPGELQSVSSIEKLKTLAAGRHMTIIPIAVNTAKDVAQGAQSLVAKGADIFLVLLDNTVVSGLESLIKVARQSDISTLATDPDSMKRGVDMAVAYDQFEIGKQVGRLVLKVLQGTSPASLPIEYPTSLYLYIKKGTPVPQSTQSTFSIKIIGQ